METFKFLASPPWDKDIDTLFVINANDEGQAYGLFIKDYNAMYAQAPQYWQLLVCVS